MFRAADSKTPIDSSLVDASATAPKPENILPSPIAVMNERFTTEFAEQTAQEFKRLIPSKTWEVMNQYSISNGFSSFDMKGLSEGDVSALLLKSIMTLKPDADKLQINGYTPLQLTVELCFKDTITGTMITHEVTLQKAEITKVSVHKELEINPIITSETTRIKPESIHSTVNQIREGQNPSIPAELYTGLKAMLDSNPSLQANQIVEVGIEKITYQLYQVEAKTSFTYADKHPLVAISSDSSTSKSSEISPIEKSEAPPLPKTISQEIKHTHSMYKKGFFSKTRFDTQADVPSTTPTLKP